MATQGYQEYSQQGNYHSMPNNNYYDHTNWNHPHHIAPHDNMHYHGYHGFGPNYGYGPNYYDSSMYHGYYPNHFNYEMNANNESNSFLPSDCSDCIFISGLPKNVQKEDIISAFSQVGKIKVAKGAQRIFLFLDRKTKDPVGDATVTFQSSESAKKAIEVFNKKDFNGHGNITVQIATPEQKNPFAEMLRRQSEANSFGFNLVGFPRGFGNSLRGNMAHHNHARMMRNGPNNRNRQNQNRIRSNRNVNRNGKHNAQKTPPSGCKNDSDKKQVLPSKLSEEDEVDEITAKTNNIAIH